MYVQHYPARLHQLYLVDLPVVLKWVVSAVKPVLQPETWGRIQVCQLPSPLFPFPAALLDFSVSQKRVSLPSTALSNIPQQQVKIPLKKRMTIKTCHADTVVSAALDCQHGPWHVLVLITDSNTSI